MPDKEGAEQLRVSDEDKAFPAIGFDDLVRHTLLDQFEFGAHAFDGLDGPYFWNSIGIDFEAPMPIDQVLEHAESVGARSIFLAHTHPLSTGDNLKFLHAKVDPREQIAFGAAPLPLGNMPSAADVTFLHDLQLKPRCAAFDLTGVVFSASGLWEFAISDASDFDADAFTEAYDALYPVGDYDGYLEEWHARGDFPNYYMEIQKPAMHESTYKPQARLAEPAKAHADALPSHDAEVAKIVSFFSDNGVTLRFRPYAECKVQPLAVMRDTLARWAETFAGQA